MSKNLIFQFFSSCNDRPWYIKPLEEIQLSKTAVQSYAKNIQVDYYFESQRYYSNNHITIEKLQVFNYKNYDKIVVLDCDIFPQKNINIFEHFQHFAGVKTSSKTINGGVVCYSKDFILQYKDFTNKRIKELSHIKSDNPWFVTDEKVLSDLIMLPDVNIECLDEKWNCKELNQETILHHKRY